MSIKKQTEYITVRKKWVDQIKTDHLILITFVVLLVTILIGVGIKLTKLQKEKQSLENTVIAQKSIISDLEENCNNLFLMLEELEYGN